LIRLWQIYQFSNESSNARVVTFDGRYYCSVGITYCYVIPVVFLVSGTVREGVESFQRDGVKGKAINNYIHTCTPCKVTVYSNSTYTNCVD